MTSICGLGQVALGPGAQRARHGPRRRRGARAPEGPRRHRDVGRRRWPARRPSASSSRSGPWPRRSRASGRRGAPRSRRSRSRDAHGRVPAEPVRAPHDLPGFARSTVDGYAVRAADTYGASEGLPSYLDVTGAVAMGRAPEVAVAPGDRGRDADRRRDARGRGRGRDGRAHAGDDARDDRGRPPGRAGRGPGARRRGRARRRRARCPPAARCARRTSACSRPRARPRCASTPGRASRSCRPATRSSPPGTEDARASARSATRPRSALAALVRDAGGDPDPRGIVPDDRDALAAVARATRSPRATSSSSRPARRSARATRPPPSSPGWASRGSGPTGSRCARASRRCWPTAAACRSSGCPGNPRSALVVFRLDRDADRPAASAGSTDPPPEPTVRARLERSVPSAAGRLDVVQVARPRRRRLTAVRGLGAPDDPHGRRRVHRRPGRRDRAARGQRGRRHPVHLRRPGSTARRAMATTPFIHDVPAAEALAAWRAACAAAGCPERVEAVRLGLARGGRPRHGRAGVGDAVVAVVRRVGDGRHRRARGRDGRREREHAGVPRSGRLRRRRHRRPAARGLRRGRHARARPPRRRGPRRAARRGRALPARALDRRGRQRGELLLPEGHRLRRGRRRRRRGRRGRRRRSSAAARSSPCCRPATRSAPSAPTPAPGVILDTNSLMLAAQAEAAGLRGACAREIVPDDPERIAAAVRDAADARRPRHRRRRARAPGATTTRPRVVERLGTLAVHGVAVRPGHPVVMGTVGTTPVLGAPGYPVSAALTFDIFAAPVLAALEGAAPAGASAGPRADRAQARVVDGDGRLGARAPRARRRRPRRDAAAARRGRAHLARARRRPARRARRPRGPPRRDRGRRRCCCAGVGEIDRTIVAIGSHDLVLDLAASRAARRRPRRHARLLERRVARRPRRAARRALPHRGLAPARSRDRRVHAALRRPGARRRRHRDRPPRAPRAGGDRRPGQPARDRGIEDLAQPGLRYVNRQRGAGTRVLLDHELRRREHRARRDRRLRARGAHAPRGGRRGRRGPRRRRPRRARRRARVRPRLRAGHPRALRPRAADGDARGSRHRAAVGAARGPGLPHGRRGARRLRHGGDGPRIR